MIKLFVCEKCGVIDHLELTPQHSSEFECAACKSGKWHNAFPRRRYDPAKDEVCNRPSRTGVSLG